jgi:hypothetical protein
MHFTYEALSNYRVAGAGPTIAGLGRGRQCPGVGLIIVNMETIRSIVALQHGDHARLAVVCANALSVSIDGTKARKSQKYF